MAKSITDTVNGLFGGINKAKKKLEDTTKAVQLANAINKAQGANNNKTSNTKTNTAKTTSTNKTKTPSANSLYNTYSTINKNKPGQFKYDDGKLEEYYNKLMNRKDFSFDLNGNALYQQYKDQFTKQGQMAMMDTIGQASAMTGGYGNSYAQAAGQQMYQQNMSQLTDKIPEIYQMALNQYQLEGDNLERLYGVAANERDTAYNRYRDTVADWQDNRNFAYDAWQNQQGFEYQQGRDKVADNQWLQEFNENKRQYNTSRQDKLKQQNIENNQWTQQFNENKRQYNTSRQDKLKQQNIENNQWQQQFDYGKQQDSIKNNQWQQQFDYGKQQDAESNRLSWANFNEGVRQFNETAKEKIRQFNESLAASKSSKSGSGSSSKSSGSSSKSSSSGYTFGEAMKNSGISTSADLSDAARSIFMGAFNCSYEDLAKRVSDAVKKGTITLAEGEWILDGRMSSGR